MKPNLASEGAANAPRSPAERIRLHRRRRRLGLRVLQIEIHAVEIEALAKRGYLKASECRDLSAIEFAVSAFISDQLMTS